MVKCVDSLAQKPACWHSRLTDVGNRTLLVEEKLIELLSDGRYHSGEALGRGLGISRAAVWKHLKKLDSLGLHVESVKGLGYRLPGGLEPLDKARISSSLSPTARRSLAGLTIHRTLISTNTHLLQLGAGGETIHGLACLAEQQLAGKGRRGRNWSSPYGRNIYLSVGWEFEGGAGALEGLSLAVGVALWQAIEKVTDASGVKLKWPNDLYYRNRKLGGVLVEIQGDLAGQCQAVIGIGINHGMPQWAGADIDQPWADISEMGAVERNYLVAAVIEQLLVMLENFTRHGFAAYAPVWRELDISRDRAVTLRTPGREYAGVARGIGDNGSLQVEIDGVIQAFHGGEVSLRVADDS